MSATDDGVSNQHEDDDDECATADDIGEEE